MKLSLHVNYYKHIILLKIWEGNYILSIFTYGLFIEFSDSKPAAV
jgi:hypothetical protein